MKMLVPDRGNFDPVGLGLTHGLEYDS